MRMAVRDWVSMSECDGRGDEKDGWKVFYELHDATKRYFGVMAGVCQIWVQQNCT